MPKTVLFINHPEAQCGVYEFGKNIGNALQSATGFDFQYLEAADATTLLDAIRAKNPVAIIYNYHPATLRWVNKELTRSIQLPQAGFIHEVTQDLADRASNNLFDYHIAADPSLILKNPLVFKTGRLVPRYTPLPHGDDAIPVIGSFGFAVGNKGFGAIIRKVQHEFDNALIRFNIPFASFGDNEGNMARALENECRALVTKPGIVLELTHHYWSQDELLQFLAGNTLNIFYNDPARNRGIASSLDFAIAARRPFAVNNSTMFRHVLTDYANLNFETHSLHDIIAFGNNHVQALYDQWSPQVLVWEYERIVTKMLHDQQGQAQFRARQTAGDKLKRAVKKLLGYKTGYYNEMYSWTRNIRTNQTDLSPQKTIHYNTVDSRKLNIILNDDARAIYAPAIQAIERLVPDWFHRKIKEANVQQGFVLDTVARLVNGNKEAKLLSVGCFEDTAYGALKRLGYNVTGIDPVVNYDLSEFVTHPAGNVASFDLLFSTSVIEHVPDDAKFMKEMSMLLKPGGYIVITCDFKEGYLPGDPKPKVDCRLYTKEDIIGRLIAATPELELVDDPAWECPNPDFRFDEINYTFASIVLRKK